MVAKVYPNGVLSATPAGMQMQQSSDASPLNCPRCDSSNTKFCYFNNYSLAQPRHFCKACKRYWTRGGTLRNVPVGGGCRKNKRLKKLQSAPLPNAAVRPPENSLSIPAADLHSLICGMPSANSNNLLFPGFGLDAQLHGYEETFQSAIEAHLLDLHRSTAWGECYREPLMLSYDDPSSRINEGLGLTKGRPMEEAMYPLGGSAAAGPSHLNWNQAEFNYGWPEFNLSVLPLL